MRKLDAPAVWLFVACLLSAIILVPVTLSAGKTITLGVHPYLSSSELYKRFLPLAEYLSRETGLDITISIAQDYQSHIEQIGRNELDIAYMGPASYVELVEKFGAKPILAAQEIDGAHTFKGVIIVRQDSGFMSLEDLQGRRFAFGDPNSTMSHLVPRYMLWKAGVGLDDLSAYEFLGSHDNVALGVLTGDFDAGGVKMETYNKYRKRGLRALAFSPEITEHVFVASNGLGEKHVESLRKAMYDLMKSEEGRKILSSIKKSITALVPVEDREYDSLRDILFTLKELGVQQ